VYVVRRRDVGVGVRTCVHIAEMGKME